MADELKPVYLIAGSDRPKVDRAVARLRARFDADAVEAHDAAEASGDDAVAACNSLGLFGAGSRLVVLENVEAWKAPDAKAVAEYLRSPTPGTTLALVGGELKKDAPIAKAVAAAGEVLIWDVQTKAIHRWIADQFKLQATPVEPEACRRLSELVGDDLYELAGEVEKLATWAHGEEVTEADVEALVAPRAGAPPWNLTDAWGARDVGGVLRAAERMLDRTGDPPARTIPRLVGSLTTHLRRARAAHRLEAQGVSPAEAAATLGIKPYPAQKLFGQIRNYSAGELDAALIRLAQLDHALKGGSRLANELELERALVEITQPRAAA
ncbi:MAG TPA: DNA polymerase III subunit delta [Gaiellaceae bacterium]|jgi:DNA polymerase-3 subunit delta|nr:DNA polymerase III subunit delta [Gaiellaceae bacterium]